MDIPVSGFMLDSDHSDPMHSHQFKGVTSFEDGHRHQIRGVTGLSIPLPNGSHYHEFSGVTSVAGTSPHRHRYSGRTSL